jgi:hypothetical protein
MLPPKCTHALVVGLDPWVLVAIRPLIVDCGCPRLTVLLCCVVSERCCLIAKIFIYNKKMEDKTYGIKTHLVEEFKQFKISRHKREMAFLGNCTLLINAIPMRTSVTAANGVISINPFPLIAGGLVGFPIPPQHLNLEVHCCVPITYTTFSATYLLDFRLGRAKDGIYCAP